MCSQGFEAPRRPSQGGDIETGSPPPPPPVNGEKDRYMDEFFKEGLLGGIKDKQRKQQEAHERTKTVTRTGEMKGIRERMQEDIEEVSRVARQVKNRLERLDKINEQSLSRKGCGVGSSSERTRTAITAALKKKLKDIVGDFSALRLKLQLEYSDRAEGKRGVAHRLIETRKSEQIFWNAILEQGRGHERERESSFESRHLTASQKLLSRPADQAPR
ncbi:g7228 [Coccomyxa viridis]|uniref:G7228 protein n=1 Tax=Coccomyxa viridis TaxID=1274662 RepID=A0ABP1FXB7_9CHLO